LVRVPLTGGHLDRLARLEHGGGSGPHALALTPAEIVYMAAGDTVEQPGGLLKAGLSGGEPTTLATTRGLARSVQVDEQTAYFIDDEGLKSVSLGGGTPRALASPPPDSFGLDGNRIYLALTDGIDSIATDGSERVELARNQDHPTNPERCGASVCWINRGNAFDAMIMRLAPGRVAQVLIDGLGEPHAWIFDGDAFFVAAGFLDLLRIPAAGGPPSSVSADGTGFNSLALDDECLYWSNLQGIWSVSRAATVPSDRGDP
jgi:hypothetical protein